MSVPAGTPACSTFTWTLSAVTPALKPRAFREPYGDEEPCRIVAVPQSPSATELPGPEATGAPAAVIPVTEDPAVPPEADLAEARAFALTVIDATVTSPPKSERPETETSACELAPDADTLDEIEAAWAIEPSAGKAKAPPTPTASGGPETAPPTAPPWPGTETWIANASALEVPLPTAEDTPPDPESTRTTAAPQRIVARRSTSPTLLAITRPFGDMRAEPHRSSAARLP